MEEILTKLDQIISYIQNHPLKHSSASIDQIMGALAKAQGMYKPLVANQEGPHGRYANITAILDSVREALSTNGLYFWQYIELIDEVAGAALLVTKIAHESGQWIASYARVLSSQTNRETGATYEYHKRQHAYMILGIAPSACDPYLYDDDGIEQEEEHMIEKIRKPVPEKAQETLTKDQYLDLKYELEGHEELAKDILKFYAVDTFADIPKGEYHKALVKIRRIKKSQEDYLKSKDR